MKPEITLSREFRNRLSSYQEKEIPSEDILKVELEILYDELDQLKKDHE